MDLLLSLQQGLRAAQLRTTHLNFHHLHCFPSPKAVDIEIRKMLELASATMPQLQMAQVWVPCHECSNTSNNLSCMESADFIFAGDEIGNSIWKIDDYGMQMYLQACRLHYLQIGDHTNTTSRTVISSNGKPCICRNISDFSIFENPLAHYAQKARLSFSFAICLRSLHNSRDIYLVEFFLQYNNREDAFVGSFLPLLLRIMEMKLKNFEFAYKGHRGEELVVEVLKQNMLSSGESSQSKAFRYESIKYKHQCLKELRMLMVMKGCRKRYPLSDFMKYLQKADLQCLQASRERKYGWVFWSLENQEAPENGANSNASILRNPIQEKIKVLMREITSDWVQNNYFLVQFWAPKMDIDRCYLETSEQPFALGCLQKGLALFRKQCMEHYHVVNEGAKEEELGPPGRVFLNGHPEITPDLCLYSPTEFPLRNHAARCCLRKYFALPVFELNQHKCVGVLEFVEFNNSTLRVIGKALEAANLSSTHVNFRPSFQGTHLPGKNVECQQLALIEIKEACKLFSEIAQLNIVEVWVPYSECPSINNTLSCMERIWATKLGWEWDLPIRQFQHIQTRKGIAGMALASETKSCFCQNLCEFSIAEQPLAHYAQHARSFLCLLLPIMKQKLTSFKVASRQELGERLVVEVIEFSEVNEVEFSELDQPDGLPITFKFVNYGGQKHSKDKQVQFAPDGMESVTSVAQAEHSTSVANLKKKDAAKEIEGRKRKTRFNITFEGLKPFYGQKLKDVANVVGVSKSTIKRICRDNGMTEWPWTENHKNNLSLFMRESANENARENMGQSSCSNLPAPAPHMPLHQNVPHTNPESSQRLIDQPKVDMVVIKAKYNDDTIRIELRRSAGVEKLLNEVSRRLNLTLGSYKLKYFDEDNEEILLAVDDDLLQCLKSPTTVGKPYIQLFVKSI